MSEELSDLFYVKPLDLGGDADLIPSFSSGLPIELIIFIAIAIPVICILVLSVILVGGVFYRAGKKKNKRLVRTTSSG